MNCKRIIAVGGSRLILAEENGRFRLPRAGEVAFVGDEGLFSFDEYEAFDIDRASALTPTTNCSASALTPTTNCSASALTPTTNRSASGVCLPGESSGSAALLSEIPLREAFGLIDHAEWEAAAKGAELVGWDKDTRFCAACGAPLRRNTEISKICPECGKEYFPTLNVAILVLVKKGEEALLVHARNFRSNFHALVAGFVETGETLEQCVAREVKEETSLEVEDVRYFGSQSWPFPRQLMIGFTAKYKSGELRFADGELTSGGFFTRENHPPLPTPPSLSRMIIDSWLKK